MRILVTNHWLKKYGGSETFTYTLIHELIRRGHKVEYYTRIEGVISKHIRNDFSLVNTGMVKERQYDLILANHRTTVDDARLFTQGFLIQTCHGTTPKLEQPNLLADCFVAVSTEVQNHLWENYSLRSEVIWNGIDCFRYKPIKLIHDRIRKVLSFSHSDDLNLKLAKYFMKKGIDFICHNKFSNPVWNTEYLINEADLVITLGRGAYEAMACGRAVLVLDNRSYSDLYGDGFVTDKNFYDLMVCNCSGRRYKRTDLRNMLDETIRDYSPDMGTTNRELALEHLNISKQADKYIHLYYEQK